MCFESRVLLAAGAVPASSQRSDLTVERGVVCQYQFVSVHVARRGLPLGLVQAFCAPQRVVRCLRRQYASCFKFARPTAYADLLIPSAWSAGLSQKALRRSPGWERFGGQRSTPCIFLLFLKKVCRSITCRKTVAWWAAWSSSSSHTTDLTPGGMSSISLL